MAVFTTSTSVDFDLLSLAGLAGAAQSGAVDTSVTLSIGGVTTQILGTGFQFGGAGPPTAGTITGLSVNVMFGAGYSITGASVSAASFRDWVLTGNDAEAKAAIFAGADSIQGSSQADRLGGFAGADTIFGSSGDDFISEVSGANYLRGDAGNDSIQGGSQFDDINGNTGNDVLAGGAGDDWVVGGKDDDLLYGNDGNDLVYGNLGNDTCDGGPGNDVVRGGQGNDSLTGGAGNDFVSGDRGDDTMTGGAGADSFHSSSDAGLDRVLDFSVAEGDRVQLDAGTTYSVSQVGSDTVLTMSAGQVILVGVSMSSLLAGSIFLA